MVDRRALLLAGAAGVLLGGCGDRGAGDTARDPSDAPTRTAIQGDVELVGGLLSVERESIALYGPHTGVKPIRTLLEQERVHAEQLERLLRDLGGTPADEGWMVGAESPLELARRIELTSLAAYVAALPKVAQPEVRGLLAAIAVTEAEHLAAVDQALGRVVVPRAFVTGERVL